MDTGLFISWKEVKMYKTALGTAPLNTETMLWGEVAYAVGASAAFSQHEKHHEAPPIL